jgi:hypothetical protein
MYKTLTRIIAERISTHLEEQNLLPAEKKGCHPGSKGCTDQLMLSKAIYEDCRRRKKNLSIAWVDYQKAFDSVPHSWVEKSIALVAVNRKIVRFGKLSMEKWNTNIFLQNKAGSNAVTTHSDTKRNIPRGFFLPFLFCIALIALKNKLNRADCGYQVHGTVRKISHLLYMDDLKMLGRNENDFKNEIKIVRTFSKDINMNFGLEKCARICLKRGRVKKNAYRKHI